MSEIDPRVHILQEVNRLLPPKKELEQGVVILIREHLNEYIFLKRKQNVCDYSEEDISIAINFLFKPIVSDTAVGFSLSIEQQTIQNFLQDKTHYSKRELGFGRKSGSIRLIAAFLVYYDECSLMLDDLIYRNIVNVGAQKISEFASNSFNDDNLGLDDLEGLHVCKKSERNHLAKLKLYIEKSQDNTHVLVQEENRLFPYDKASRSLELPSANGWGVITDDDMVLIMLRCSESGSIHCYTSYSVTLINESHRILDNIILLKASKPNYTDLDDDKKFIDSEKLIRDIQNKVYIFQRDDSLLEFERPFDDKKRRRSLADNPLMKGRAAAGIKIEKNRKTRIMDEEEKKEISQEVFEMLSDIEKYDGDRIFELLDKGASINHRDEKTGATPMHALARWNIEFVEEVMDKSQEEYDHLIRDNNKHLASWYAKHRRNDAVYLLLRGKEIDAGQKVDVFPAETEDVFKDQAARDNEREETLKIVWVRQQRNKRYPSAASEEMPNLWDSLGQEYDKRKADGEDLTPDPDPEDPANDDDYGLHLV